MRCLRALLLAFIFTTVVYSGNAQGTGNSSNTWLTLKGDSPLMVAFQGLYGMFPPSSDLAYSMAVLTSPSALLWCDVQLSKDGQGFCFPNINLANASDVGSVFANMSRQYWVNGNLVTGWFASDFTMTQILENLTLYQDVFSRTQRFDGQLGIQTVENVDATPNRSGLWLNIEHSLFFSQQNLSMRSYVISVLKNVVVDYISSPETQFLQSIRSRIPQSTRLVYRILGRNEVDASTNRTYGSILSNLSSVMAFADGILVDRSYVYPTAGGYLQKSTTLVSDAHSIGLQVFVSGIDNDVQLSYNASYNPVVEAIFFIANGEFSVDGIVSSFPITSSSAIGCYSDPAQNTTTTTTTTVKIPTAPLIISPGGASGDYPSSTDIAFQKAIEYGADFIGCSVHLTSDRVPICAASVDLVETTDVLNSSFRTRLASPAPGLGSTAPGIFTFNLTWSDIQTLTPVIQQPYLQPYGLRRNPANKNAGKMVTLSEFLDIARNGSVPGVLIDIENAAFLAERLRLNVTGIVSEALSRGGFGNLTRVMIQSSNPAVLEEFRGDGNYELVYAVLRDIGGLDAAAVDDIRSFASSVVLSKHSLFPASDGFITGVTDVVPRFHSRNISVYVGIFSNEFISQSWDFFADSLVEINSFVSFAAIDGIVTDYPRTGNMFKNNRCSGLSADMLPAYMTPVQPGSLLTILSPTALPPAIPPSPLLQDSDISEPPLTPVTVSRAPPPVVPHTNRSSAIPPSSSGQPPRFISAANALVSAATSALVAIALM